MCNQMKKEDKYKQYDNIVQKVMINVLVEHERNDKYLLYEFDPTNDSNKLYFNVTTVVADLNRKQIYLDMPFFEYIKFKMKRKKKRTNIKWFGPFQKRKMLTENKVSVTDLMTYVSEQLNFDIELFKEINDEYYGWIE